MPLTRLALIPHPERHALLLVPQGEGWALPAHVDEGSDELLLEPFNRALGAQLGGEFVTIRAMGEPFRSPEGVATFCYHVERRGGEAPRGGARWLPAAEAIERLAHSPFERAAVEAWWREATSGERPAQRSPWAFPGWHDEAVAWIEATLAQHGRGPLLAVEQIRSWAITHMLKVVTPAGELYFKAAHPMFPHEARLTRYLAERYPAHVPALLAADGARNWLLMEPFAGTSLGELKELSAWKESVGLFARMQIESVDEAEALLALGCPERRLEQLPAAIDPLFQDEAAMQAGEESALSEAQIAALRALRPTLEEAIRRLLAFRIPPTLLHGDLHARNIVITGEGPLLYDWSDGALAHPFFELLTTGRDLRRVIEDEAAPEALRRAYLEPWRRYATPDELDAALDLSQKLLPLYHALSYHWIFLNTEPSARWELGGGVGYFLKLLLANFGADPDASG